MNKLGRGCGQKIEIVNNCLDLWKTDTEKWQQSD